MKRAPLHNGDDDQQRNKIVTKGGVDGGRGSAVDGRDGKGVLGGIGVELAEVVTSDDTSGDDIEKTHDCKRGLVGWEEEEKGVVVVVVLVGEEGCR